MISEIDSHCLKYDRYGFTIPYLYKIELDAGRKKSIAEILEFLAIAEKPYIISYCTDLDEYIIGLHKKEFAPLKMYKNFGNLYYDQDSLGNFKTLIELNNFMTKQYQKYIDNKTFSKNIKNNTWD